jgi:hypothetical protein
MSYYKKRPVVIEAFQWTGGPDQTEDPIWAVEAIKSGKITFGHSPARMMIQTLEGEMTASLGDFIIKGIHGEIYPCKPDIFLLTYEPLVP